MTDRSLVGSDQPPLEQGDHAVNPWHQLRWSLLLPLKKSDLVLVVLVLQGQVPQPSVWMTLPGATESCTKGIRLSAEAFKILRMRIRPIPGPSS